MIFFACVRIRNMYQNLINKSKNTTRMNSKLIFQEKLPTENPVNVAELTDSELNSGLEKGYADMVVGRTKPESRYLLIFAKITAYDL